MFPVHASERPVIHRSPWARIRSIPERKRRTATVWLEGAARASLICVLGVGPADTVAAQSLPPDTFAVQSLPADTFADARARSLFEAARTRWLRDGSSILSYDATISSRFAIKLRTPLKDRTLFRAEETSRVHWNADSTLVVQTLAARSVTADGTEPPGRVTMTDAVFDPTSDQFIFGFPSTVGTGGGDEETRPTTPGPDGDPEDRGMRITISFEHPIAPGAEAHYRYRTSDSLTLALPDGRSVRAVSLEFIPRESVGRLLSGILWIEPESGSLVRAVYRLSEVYDVGDQVDGGPLMWLIGGLVMPLEFNVTLVTLEYSLWDLAYWMPTRWRIEGVVRAGVLRAAGTVE